MKKVSHETIYDKKHIQLFLDISSTNSGVVIYREESQEVLLDSINLKNLHKLPQMKQVDFEKVKIGCIKNYLDALKSLYEIDVVYIEGIFIHPAFRKSSEVLLKIHGFLMGYFLDTPCMYIPPANIKKAITGKGNADKCKVKDVLEKYYQYEFENNDESDAFALLVTTHGWNNYIIQGGEIEC